MFRFLAMAGLLTVAGCWAKFPDNLLVPDGPDSQGQLDLALDAPDDGPRVGDAGLDGPADAASDLAAADTSLDGPAGDTAAPDLPGDAAPDLLLPVGATCIMDTECQGGHCVDGYCCDTSCGPCSACNLSGSEGTCAPVPAGQDPNGDCAVDPVAGCGFDGECDGFGACRKYPSGTQCAPAQCSGAVSLVSAQTCDGNGTCTGGGTTSCNPYKCDTANNQCFSSCTVATEGTQCTTYRCDPGTGKCYDTCTAATQSTRCKANAVCLNNQCVGGLTNGTPCVASSQCQSGNCADGVCCDTSCVDLCEACDLAGTVGTCTLIPAGQDPKDDCVRVDATSTCGFDGTCDGLGNCRKHVSGTPCAAATCLPGSPPRLVRPARACDGAGNCTGPGVVDCGSFACNPATAMCYTSCTNNNKGSHCSFYQCNLNGGCYQSCTKLNHLVTCKVGVSCNQGECSKKLPIGEGCTSSTGCLSGNCRDNICCDTTCQGSCQACDVPGMMGTCSPVPAGQDLHNDCSQDPVGSCDKDGTCDGTGGCRLYDSATVCEPGECKDLTELRPSRTCDGVGSCQSKASIFCDPFACDASTLTCHATCTAINEGSACGWAKCDTTAGTCYATCTSDAECKSIAKCDGGTCIAN